MSPIVLRSPGRYRHMRAFPTSPAGLSRAHSSLQQRVGQRSALIVAEGTGSFGAILTARLQTAGRHVIEAAQDAASDPERHRHERRARGGSDPAVVRPLSAEAARPMHAIPRVARAARSARA
ncbi:MAG: hypothetical protein ABI912_01580, partial [Actinomycetota bacterium]